MRRLIAPATIAGTLAAAAAVFAPAATAQGRTGDQDRPGLLDFLSLDVIVQRVLQSGVMMLRTQMDMTYGDMSVDFLTGRITLTEVKAWPLPEWDENGDCVVSFDRVTLRGGALDRPDRVRIKVQMVGLDMPPSCLPPEPRQGLAMAGLDRVTAPRMTLDIDYGLPQSDAEMRLYADLAGLGVVDAVADFAYFWFDGREDLEEPVPVMFLDHASVSFENRGLWQAVQGLLPPMFTGNGAALVVEGALGQEMIKQNRRVTGDGVGTLTPAQEAFVKSAGKAWAGFIADPQTLVLETDIDGNAFIDIEAIDRDPRVLFDTVRPSVALHPAVRARILPSQVLAAALAGTDLPPEDARAAGIALVSGVGAPRNLEAGMAILRPIAEAGDGEAAMALVRALEHRAPKEAYRWALLAGKAGTEQAVGALDRIERALPYADVLKVQAEVSGKDVRPAATLAKVALIRDAAASRMLGKGVARSYEIAAHWAMLAAAAGDAESHDILEELDERARLSGPAAMKAWAEAEARAATLATEVWTDKKLAERFGVQ